MNQQICLTVNWIYLKLPSLFAARLFGTFHNKLHNMKALVILSHHDHHFSHLLVFMKNCTFMCPCELFWSIFVRKNSPQLTVSTEAHIRSCAQISGNTLLYLPSLKENPPFCGSYWLQLDWQFREHSMVMKNFN